MLDVTPFKAILWDLDGTIIDTAFLHYLSWDSAFTERGIPFSYQRFLAAFGQNNQITVFYNHPSADDHEIDAIVDRKETLFRQSLRTGVPLFEDALEMLRDFAARGFRQALATSSPEENIAAVFDSTDLGGFFEQVISGDRLPPKPSPDIFLLTAKQIGVDPAECLVIEDSIMGVRAGKAAGMRVAAFTHSFSAEELHEADWLIGGKI